MALLYFASYVGARVSHLLVHYAYGLYPHRGDGQPQDGLYDEIRGRDFERHHPIDGWTPEVSALEIAFAPMTRIELAIRGIPRFQPR